MCCAVYQEPGRVITEEIFRRLYEKNGDGFGMCYFDGDDEMRISKFLDVDLAFKHYTLFCEGDGKKEPAILVFRYATNRETKGIKNLHPFKVSDEMAFVHNGCFTDLGTEKTSDTYEFAKILKEIANVDKEFLEKPLVMNMIVDYVGVTNILIFLNSKRERYIFNEKKGNWVDGIWYSNNQYVSVISTPRIAHTPYVHKCSLCNEVYEYGDLMVTWYKNTSFKMCRKCFDKSINLKTTMGTWFNI